MQYMTDEQITKWRLWLGRCKTADLLCYAGRDEEDVDGMGRTLTALAREVLVKSHLAEARKQSDAIQRLRDLGMTAKGFREGDEWCTAWFVCGNEMQAQDIIDELGWGPYGGRYGQWYADEPYAVTRGSRTLVTWHGALNV